MRMNNPNNSSVLTYSKKILLGFDLWSSCLCGLVQKAVDVCVCPLCSSAWLKNKIKMEMEEKSVSQTFAESNVHPIHMRTQQF